jgi:hypothetical protein
MPGANKPALPEKCVVTFSDYAEHYAGMVIAQNCFKFVSCTRVFNIFISEYKGIRFAFVMNRLVHPLQPS